MKFVMGRSWRPMACACLAATCLSAEAATLELEFGAEHTDNVSRTPTDEQSETVALAGLGFGLDLDRPRLDANVGANFEYRRYMDDSYDDEVVGGLSAIVSYAFIPDRFVWSLEDNFGQISVTRLEAETPANRQNFNYLTTGPDITIPMGSRTAAQLAARWSDTYYEISEEDSQTREGSFAIIRTLSEQTSVSLNGSVSEVNFEREPTGRRGQYADSDIKEGFIRLDATGVRTTLVTDVGYAETSQEDAASDGFLLRLQVSRELSSRSTLTFAAGSEFADTGTSFRLDQTFTGVETETQNEIASADIYRTTYAFLGLTTGQDRTSFTISVNGNKERHEQQRILDRNVLGAALLFERRLSPRMSIDLTGTYSEDEFVNADLTFDEWSAGIGASWQLFRSWSLRVSADHLSGSGDGISRDYDENRAALSLSYSIGQSSQ
jgi:hypothetical protein